MEEISMFVDWQNQYCENGYTTEINLQIQCNPQQNSNDILQRNRKITPQIIWKHKQAGGVSIPPFQPCNQTTGIQECRWPKHARQFSHSGNARKSSQAI
jgi:hypothetical protein